MKMVCTNTMLGRGTQARARWLVLIFFCVLAAKVQADDDTNTKAGNAQPQPAQPGGVPNNGTQLGANGNVAAPNAATPSIPMDLFGNPTQPVANSRPEEQVSPLRQKLASGIESFVDAEKEHDELMKQAAELQGKFQALELEWKSLPQEAQQCQLEIINANIELGGLGVPNPNNPIQITRIAQEKERLRINRNKLQFLQQRKDNGIPSERRELNKVSAALNNKCTVRARETINLINGVGQLLGRLSLVSKSDAKSIREQCEVCLIQNPQLVAVNILKGFSLLHMERPELAKAAFRDSQERLKQGLGIPMRNQEQMLLLGRCEIGLLWCEIDSGNSDVALGKVSTIKKRGKRGNVNLYEATVGEGILEERRGRLKDSLNAFTRAQDLSRRNPAAYRFAADLISRYPTKILAKAKQYAQNACDVDENDDYRNPLSLAVVAHLLDDTTTSNTALEKAREQAGAEFKTDLESEWMRRTSDQPEE